METAGAAVEKGEDLTDTAEPRRRILVTFLAMMMKLAFETSSLWPTSIEIEILGCDRDSEREGLSE